MTPNNSIPRPFSRHGLEVPTANEYGHNHAAENRDRRELRQEEAKLQRDRHDLHEDFERRHRD